MYSQQNDTSTPIPKASSGVDKPTNPHQVIPPESEDIITGVSNGDVDWLFRGKSKKLVKKMSTNQKDDKGDHKPKKDSSTNTTTNTTTKSDVKQSQPSTNDKPSVEKPKIEVDTSLQTTQETSLVATGDQQKSTTTATAPLAEHKSKPTTPVTQKQQQQQQPQPPQPSSPVTSTQKQPEKVSKLSKLRIGRSRSASASVAQIATSNAATTPTNTTETKPVKKRRESINFVPPSLTSDLAYDDPEASVLKSQSTSTSNNTNSSASTSPGVSRSNSKKGLFSSLSSKFRSLSSKTTPTNSSPATPAPQSQQPPQQQQQPTTDNHHHVNPAFVGSVTKSQKEQEDLISLTKTAPAGMGIPIKRKTLNTKSSSNGGSPIFKESFHDENTHHHHHHHPHLPHFPHQQHGSPSSSPSEGTGLRFFKRRGSSVVAANTTTPRVVLNKNPNREKVTIEDLRDLKLRRVAFSVDKLEHDPQQQIPARKPKRGNVLIPQDINAPVPRLNLGISVENKDNQPTNHAKESQYSDKEIALAEEAQRKALIEAEKHAQEAHKQAKKIALEVATFKNQNIGSIKEGGSGGNEDEEDDEKDTAVDEHVANDVSVDGPLHVHEQHFEDEIHTEGGTVSLETIYTRCCHLREILPIPATLRQLKNKTAPLEVLKMLNPKPTLIDVLSFSDFIAITPINTVIFDNVTMTTEMLKNFLGSLIYNKQLEKLSLRNVAIDEMGWKYLCKFLAKNKTIKKLDISQQRIKQDTPETSIRGNMNWELFIQSLILRGGIEELVINGCKLSDEVFEKLINKAVKITTYRLGIAGVELSVNKAQIVADWLTDPNSQCVGVDVAFNDLSQGQLQPFINAFNKGVSHLVFFSLNSTSLLNVEETSELIQAMVNVKTLRFLDLSAIPQVFPAIISSLAKFLPLYSNLKRIHFDLNELSEKAIGLIAAVLVKVPHLVHVSLLGNPNLTNTSAAALYSAVKHSHTLFALDIDYDLISDELSQRIAFYLMRNMDRSLKPEYPLENTTDKPEDLMFDGSLLMETAEKMFRETDKGGKDEIKMQKLISETIFERTKAIRKDIHKTINTLFEQRNQGTLSFEGKENLVRFCLLDSTLEKLVHMYEEHAKTLITPSQSTNTTNDSSGVIGTGSTPDKTNTSLSAPLMHPTINIHENANELITAGPILSPHVNREGEQSSYFLPMPKDQEDNHLTPHQVVIDSANGKNIPIDNLTGRPVLMHSLSSTSVHAKEQEIEEGEFHKFGFYLQQQNTEKPNDDIPILNTLPSGAELRDAIMAAKGVDNVNELIDRINNHCVKIDGVKHHEQQQQKQQQQKPSKEEQNHAIKQDHATAIEEVEISDTDSIDSHEHPRTVDPVVNEVYDKLLNAAEKVRLNKDI